MRVLITAGPTREPIDPVRYIGNRSSGRMGASLARSALLAGHEVTLILGPVTATMPAARRIDVETTAQMHAAVLAEFATHDLLIMAAAPADYRPVQVAGEKLARQGRLVIECEPTEDIVAEAGRGKRPNQRIVGFSLESTPDMGRVREKMLRKGLDLAVYNPPQTMDSGEVEAILLWPDGRSESLPRRSKEQFAEILLDRAAALFAGTGHR